MTTTYHAVLCSGFTGDEPQAIFRYSEEARAWAGQQAGQEDFEGKGYSVQRVKLDLRWIDDDR